MIRGKTIICFASGYEAPPTSKHHIMHLLAEHNSVLWVNYHASRAPSASSSDLLYIGRKLAQVLRGLRQVRPNLHVLTPLVAPLPGSAAAKAINRKLLIRSIHAALDKIAAGPTQVWSFAPDIAYLLGNFDESKVVYYCVDDFASFTGYDRRQVLQDEERLCRAADLVVTTSQALWEAKQAFTPHIMLVPHGVDYQHFAKAVNEPLPEPEDLAAIGRPRLGFFGLIRDWVDLDLVVQAAVHNPQWQFVFIGDSKVDLSPFRMQANLHFLGNRPYESLPAYCRHLDVGLIPFKINDLTLAVNPIKLREYLAAGLPVVSTPLPEVHLYRDQVYLAGTAAEFSQSIAAALADSTDRRRRSQSMAGETWEGKLEQICRRLEAPMPAEASL